MTLNLDAFGWVGFFIFIFVVVLKQDLAVLSVLPWLTLNSQFSCLSLPVC
jgi:hypothetical protein